MMVLRGWRTCALAAMDGIPSVLINTTTIIKQLLIAGMATTTSTFIRARRPALSHLRGRSDRALPADTRTRGEAPPNSRGVEKRVKGDSDHDDLPRLYQQTSEMSPSSLPPLVGCVIVMFSI
jgi:hypothetical protein